MTFPNKIGYFGNSDLLSTQMQQSTNPSMLMNGQYINVNPPMTLLPNSSSTSQHTIPANLPPINIPNLSNYANFSSVTNFNDANNPSNLYTLIGNPLASYPPMLPSMLIPMENIKPENISPSLSPTALSQSNAYAQALSSLGNFASPLQSEDRRASVKSNKFLHSTMEFLIECKKTGVLPEPSVAPNPEVNLAIDDFLASQGIDVTFQNPTSPEKLDLILKVEQLKLRYKDELGKLNQVCNDFCVKLIYMLKDQSVMRPIGEQETYAKLVSIQKRFDTVRLALKQHVCNAILGLQHKMGPSNSNPSTHVLIPQPPRRMTPSSANDALQKMLDQNSLSSIIPSVSEKINGNGTQQPPKSWVPEKQPPAKKARAPKKKPKKRKSKNPDSEEELDSDDDYSD